MQRRPLHELKPVPGMASRAALGRQRSERLCMGEDLNLELTLHPQLHKEKTYCRKDVFVYSIHLGTQHTMAGVCVLCPESET